MTCLPQVYLYILSNKRLVGCVVTERITSASPVVSDEAYTSANQSLTAPAVMSPLPSVNLQPLTPMSAPPLGQPRNSTSDVPDRLAASCMKPSAASATGVTSPCPAHEQSHQSKKLSASQCLQVCGAAQAHSPAHTAVNRGSMQQRKQKGTLLTRWLVASKYNAAADGSASPMHATTAPSADSAAACNAAMQNPAAIGAEGMTQEWSRSACPDQPSTASSLPWCSSTVQAAQSMEDYRGVGQSQLPNTSGFAAQTQAQASSLTAAHQSSPADCLSLDSQIVPPLHCSLTSNSGRSSSSPAVQPAYSRPQHAIMLDTAQSVPASCGVKVMWVSSDHQRKGVATQLLDAVRYESDRWL